MPDSNITKRALAEAMKKLMHEKAFAKISVGDVCEQCGMNRKSFYYHFQDKYELVNWIYYTEFVEGIREKTYESAWDFFLDMCSYFENNRAFYLNALDVTGQNSFREYYSQIFRGIIQMALEGTFADPRREAFYTVFFTDAFLAGIERWLREHTYSSEEFVSLIRDGVEGTARRVMERLDGTEPSA